MLGDTGSREGLEDGVGDREKDGVTGLEDEAVVELADSVLMREAGRFGMTYRVEGEAARAMSSSFSVLLANGLGELVPADTGGPLREAVKDRGGGGMMFVSEGEGALLTRRDRDAAFEGMAEGVGRTLALLLMSTRAVIRFARSVIVRKSLIIPCAR